MAEKTKQNRMNEEMKELGQIERTHLGVEDHGIFTYMLTINFGGMVQGFGGYCLDDRNWSTKTTHTAAGAIIRLLEAVGVSKWEELVGSPVWAYRKHRSGKIFAIEAPDFIPHKGRCDLEEYFKEEQGV